MHLDLKPWSQNLLNSSLNKMRKIDIDIDYFYQTVHTEPRGTSRYLHKKRYHEEEKGRLIVENIAANAGDIHSVYLLSSGRFLVVRTVKHDVEDRGGATNYEFEGSVEKGDDLAQMFSTKDIDKLLALLEDILYEKFAERFDEFLPNIGHEEVGWVVRFLLRGGHTWTIYEPVKHLYERYKNELVNHLISAMEERHFKTSTTAIELLGEMGKVEPLVQALGKVAKDRREFILVGLGKNSQTALIPLLKAHKKTISARKDATLLEEAINRLRLPRDLVEPLIEAIENDEVTLSQAISVVGEFGARGNQRTIEYLTHLYKKDKNPIKKELAGKQLDRLGKRPKSWHEKLFR